MNLTRLPNEILWAIASFLPRQRDIFALLATNHDLHNALVGTLYHFNGLFYHGKALSFVANNNNLSFAQHLMNGLRAASKEDHAPFSPTDLQTEDEETGSITRRRDADYWEDIYTHPLYRQGYSIRAIVNIQHALVIAIGAGHADIVRLLLDRGARVNFYRGKHLQSPRPEYGSRRGRWQRVPIDPPPLFVAVKSGHIDLVKLLLQRGAKAELYAPSPLYRAVEDNRRDIAAILVQHGVHSQGTALKLAVLRCDRAMVTLLLDSGLNISDSGGPALYAAIQRGDRDMVHLLESQGATLTGLGDQDRENWEKEDGDGDQYGIRRRIRPTYFEQLETEVDEEEEQET